MSPTTQIKGSSAPADSHAQKSSFGALCDFPDPYFSHDSSSMNGKKGVKGVIGVNKASSVDQEPPLRRAVDKFDRLDGRSPTRVCWGSGTDHRGAYDKCSNILAS